MDIVGPISKQKRNTLVLYMVMTVALGLYCVYDGFFNATFIQNHSGADGKPDSTLVFNRYAPPAMLLVAAVFGWHWYRIRDRRVVATDRELIITDTLKIPYDVVEQIDKTHFEDKGFFVITYKTDGGRETTARLHGRDYDDLGPILDRLVEKIS